MRFDNLTRPALLVLLSGGLAACNDTTTGPRLAASDFAAADRRPAPPSGQPGRVQPDTAKHRLCRDDGLTEAQIEAIRAAYNAYLDEIADDLRLIAEVAKEAREAAQAGASREKIAAILARADAAKTRVAEATERLRTKIHDITHDDRVPCFVVLPQV